MKKKFLTLIAVVAVVAIAGWNIIQNRSDNELSDVALANVEALASETIPAPSYNNISQTTPNGIYYICTSPGNSAICIGHYL